MLDSVRGRWQPLVAFGIIDLAIPIPPIAVGEQHVASSLAAIIVAAAPLFVPVLALRFDDSERTTGWRLVGLAIGLLGVVALVGIDVAGNSDELVGALAILGATFCYAVGAMLLKRHLADLDSRASMGASLIVAALVLSPSLLVDQPSEVPTREATIALLALGLCISGAYAFFATLVAEVGAGRALVVAYVIPLVALALGVALLDERPGVGAVGGLLLILGGSWLATGGRPPP